MLVLRYVDAVAAASIPALVRHATIGDAADIAAIYRPYVLDSVISFEEVAPRADEIEQRMLAIPKLPWLVATRDQRVAGYAYASKHRERAAYRWSVDVSVYLDSRERGRGTGRAPYERLLPEVRDLGYVNAYAGIALPNDASVRLHEAIGFTMVGVFRTVGFKRQVWRDVGWWQLTLVEPPLTPSEPRPWTPSTASDANS